jgi:6-phosphofructokinase 1
MEYTRDLGYCAARYIIEGGTEALVSIQDGRFRPIPFHAIMDPETGRMRVRMVDIESDRYKIARSYMLRLKKEDFDDARELARLAHTAGITPDEMKRQFRGLVQSEPGPMSLHRIATH